jgi:hypothetical protein
MSVTDIGPNCLARSEAVAFVPGLNTRPDHFGAKFRTAQPYETDPAEWAVLDEDRAARWVRRATSSRWAASWLTRPPAVPSSAPAARPACGTGRYDAANEFFPAHDDADAFLYRVTDGTVRFVSRADDIGRATGGRPCAASGAGSCDGKSTQGCERSGQL